MLLILRATRRPVTITHLLLSALVAGCTAAPAPDPVPPHDYLAIDSVAVGESRRIAVYTPPTYSESDRTYPVLYMPDGGVEEDFPHIATTIDSLIREGAIAPVLVVGIENTERRRDLTPDSSTEDDRQYAPMTDGAAAFRAFLRDELIPEIERRYRTNGERAIVGESLAGLFVIDTFLREPEIFGRYIAMDPSLWWDDHALVRRAEERLPSLEGMSRTLWFAGSDAVDIHRYTEALATLLEEKAPTDLKWTYEPRPGEQHHTIFRATKEEAFRWALWPGEIQDTMMSNTSRRAP